MRIWELDYTIHQRLIRGFLTYLGKTCLESEEGGLDFQRGREVKKLAERGRVAQVTRTKIKQGVRRKTTETKTTGTRGKATTTEEKTVTRTDPTPKN